MAVEIDVKHRDGTITRTKVWASTEVAFEEKFGGLSWTEAFTQDHPRQTYLYFAAFHSIQESGSTPLTFAEWMKTVDEVSPVVSIDPPQEPEAPHGSSEQ